MSRPKHLGQAGLHYFMTRAIKVSEDPMAPFKLNDAYGANEALGKLMAKMGTRAEVTAFTERLLSGFTGEELDEISSNPNFICALAALLNQALISYGAAL